MKPLHVKLIHRDNDNYRRLCGWWSYPVPEFTWDAYKVPPFGFHANPDLAGYDLVVMDDWIFGKVEKNGTPLAYAVVDSARSEYQLNRNLEQARQADLVLVDSDALHKFRSVGKPMRRFAYAVNEQLYKPAKKEYDVAFLCWPTDERRRIERQVRDICYKRGYSYLTGTWDNPYEYAQQVGRAKVVVHYAHVKRARSWRVFDVMACQGALLTSVLPIVDGDGIEPGKHYWEYTDDLEEQLVGLVSTGCWERIAKTGYEHVMAHHTWAIRAAELRQTINEVLGL